jgi:hypothetical protein
MGGGEGGTSAPFAILGKESAPFWEFYFFKIFSIFCIFLLILANVFESVPNRRSFGIFEGV